LRAPGLGTSSSIKYTDQWEKAVLLRLGRYRGLRGPGYFAIVPILDRVAYIVDQRIRTAAFGAESCLTRDTVPVNVDAIAFWIVRDAERAALEVQDYDEAVILSAQTALRDAIGKHDLAELIQSRVELGHGLKVALVKMANWGSGAVRRDPRCDHRPRSRMRYQRRGARRKARII
jgi:regulator of protease activity HflC (stomatin/prohibitin superfamily)